MSKQIVKQNTTRKKKSKVEKEVENLQKSLGVDSSKFLTFDQIFILHNQQYSNIIKDFACNQNKSNIY